MEIWGSDSNMTALNKSEFVMESYPVLKTWSVLKPGEIVLPNKYGRCPCDQIHVQQAWQDIYYVFIARNFKFGLP